MSAPLPCETCSVNGVNFVYPCGIEMEVPEHIYHAVKAHLA